MRFIYEPNTPRVKDLPIDSKWKVKDRVEVYWQTQKSQAKRWPRGADAMAPRLHTSASVDVLLVVV